MVSNPCGGWLPLWVVPLALLPLGCSVVSPPPMRMMHESVLRTEPGAGSVAIVGGGGAGIFLDDAAGGEGRLSVQATREMDFDLAGGAGMRVGDDHDGYVGMPQVVGWGRVGGRYRPAHLDWVSLRFGCGGIAANTGLFALTTDVGVSFGASFLNRVRPYAGLSLALSAPVHRGPNVNDREGDLVPRRPATTLWIGGGMGVTVRVVGHLELGGEALVDLGWSPRGDTAVAFGGTAVMRYTFGPVRRSSPKHVPDTHPLGNGIPPTESPVSPPTQSPVSPPTESPVSPPTESPVDGTLDVLPAR